MKNLGPVSHAKDVATKEYVDSNVGHHVELTQAEYELLSPSEKNNGTVYFISDGEPEYTIINDSVPIGAIQSYAGSAVPYGWLFCDGSAVSRVTYPELFNAIGVTYGSGDGSTTFNLPDLRGRVITGVGTCDGITYNLGDKKDAGVPNITGTHKLGWSDKSGGGIILSSGSWSGAFSGYHSGNAYFVSSSNDSASTSHNNWVQFDASGSNSHYGASTTVQPNTTVLNCIIKAKNTVNSGRLEELDPEHILFDMLYPIGSYYETSDATFDPNVQWTGTWILETAGQVHVSAGTGYAVGDTGGEATHTLTVDEMPSHKHNRITFEGNGSWTVGDNSGIGGTQKDAYSRRFTSGYDGPASTAMSHWNTSSAGHSQAHNNMQPYIVVNRWHRTA